MLRKENNSQQKTRKRWGSQNNLRVANSRKLDNHYDQEVHNRPWQPWNKSKPQYKYTDSGLGIITNNRTNSLKRYKSKHQIQEQIKQMVDKKEDHNIRWFKEYDQIRDDQIYITVEYCTNCKNHQVSTRHDEKKYHQLAQKVKNEVLSHFPVVRVYLKPLLMDYNDKKISQIYLQQRLGAFEIQVCSKLNGKFQLQSIFSKIKQKKWPNIEQDVVNVIPQYLNHQSLILQFYLEDDENEEQDEQREIRFKKIQVVLRPHRLNNSQNNTRKNMYTNMLNESQSYLNLSRTNATLIPNYANKSRPGSGGNRSRSQRSVQSQNKTIQSIKQKIDVTDDYYVMKADSAGRVYFNNIPEDNYIMEMAETNDFKAITLQIRMFEMIENNLPFIKRIQLEKQKLCFVTITLHYQNMFITEAIVEIKSAELEDDVKGVEIKENPPKSGKYSIQLEAGQYRIDVKRKGFESYSQFYSLKQGSNDLKIDLLFQGEVKTESMLNQDTNKPNYIVQEDPKRIVIQVYDILTRNSLAQATISMKFDKKCPVQYETNHNGEACVDLLNFDYHLAISRKDYIDISDSNVLMQKNYSQLANNDKLQFPMAQIGQQNTIRLILSTSFDKDLVQLQLIDPDSNVHDSIDSQTITLQNNTSNGYCLLEFNNHQSDGIYRIICKLNSLEIFNSINLKLFLIIGNVMNIIEIPASYNPMLYESNYWDIGFIVAKQNQFVEINGLCHKKLENLSFIKDYQSFLEFIRNETDLDLKSILGFNNNDRIMINNDILIQQDTLINSVQQKGYQINDRNVFEHLIASAIINEQLFISFNRLFDKLKNIKQIEFIDNCKLEVNHNNDD